LKLFEKWLQAEVPSKYLSLFEQEKRNADLIHGPPTLALSVLFLLDYLDASKTYGRS
jgi:hypothetical protein